MPGQYVTALLAKVCDLYALATIEANRAWYLEHEVFGTWRSKSIIAEVDLLCGELRPYSLALVEGLGVPQDWLVHPRAAIPPLVSGAASGRGEPAEELLAVSLPANQVCAEVTNRLAQTSDNQAQGIRVSALTRASTWPAGRARRAGGRAARRPGGQPSGRPWRRPVRREQAVDVVAEAPQQPARRSRYSAPNSARNRRRSNSSGSNGQISAWAVTSRSRACLADWRRH